LGNVGGNKLVSTDYCSDSDTSSNDNFFWGRRPSTNAVEQTSLN
jgi:hypothetical protein